MRERLTDHQAKELSCLMALREGYGLYQHGLTIWKVFPNGDRLPLTSSENASMLWHDAVDVIDEEARIKKATREQISPWVKRTANIAHNLVIHPLMVLPIPLFKDAVQALHDWTADLMEE